MCEMLTSPLTEHDFQYAGLFKKNITEPDNGHKTETITKLDFKQESERLKSFKNWKSQAVRAENLAKAGFYFLDITSPPDLVRCAFCNVEICSWEPEDDAFEEHAKWSPDCPFIKRQPTLFKRQASGQDVCGNAEIIPNSIPESQAFRLLNSRRNIENVKGRLDTFVNWPTSSKQKPELLAEAGFYYRGIEDHTICFVCGGALRDWKDDDDPWEQHALWFPQCTYLLSKKGKQYIEEVKRKFKSADVSVTKEEECKNSVSGTTSTSSSPDDGVLLCKICDSNERNVIFMPCKHILACDECARQFDICPVCRKRIDNKMKVFLS